MMRALLVCCVFLGLLYPALAKQDEQGMSMGRHHPHGGRPGRPGPPPTNMTEGEMLPPPEFCFFLNMMQELNMTLSDELTAVLELCPTDMAGMAMGRHRRPGRPSSNITSPMLCFFLNVMQELNMTLSDELTAALERCPIDMEGMAMGRHRRQGRTSSNTTEGDNLMPSPTCCFFLNVMQEFNMTLSDEQTAALELCPTDMEGMAMGRRRPHGGRPGRPGPPPTNMTEGEMLPPPAFCFFLIMMQELNMTLSDEQTAALELCPTDMEVTMIGRRRPIPHHGSPPPGFTGPPPSGPPPPMMGRRRPKPHRGSPLPSKRPMIIQPKQ